MTTEMRRAEIPENMEIYDGNYDPYHQWIEQEGIKFIRGFAFESLHDVELGPWDRKGGSGAVIAIPSESMPNDAHLIEIKPGGKSEPEHHMYEETTYIVSGRGATSVWLDEGHKSTFEWQPGSLITVPLNAWYQHYNASGTEPARYLSMTNAPPVMRQWRSNEFIFNNPFHFKDRFAGDDEDYFSGAGKVYRRKGTNFGTVWRTNFVPNADTMPLWDYLARGAGGINTHFDLAGNVTKAHISEFPVGTYKKGHRHGPGAHLVILGGVGFSNLWWDGKEMVRADWKKGSMVVVPEDATYHQHFNTSKEPARYLALRGPNGTPENWGESNVSIKEGGMQIEYEDEAREVHERFESDLVANGAPCRMKAFIPWCTGDVGPTSESDT